MSDYKEFDLPSLTNKIVTIVGHSYWKKVEPGLVNFLRQSRKLTDPVELLNYQLVVAGEIIKLEKQISYFAKSADPEKQNNEWVSRELYLAHRRILKQIMDGLAWRSLNFERAPLRLLAEHPQTGFLSPGFIKEMKEAVQIVSHAKGARVILNDLTNVLRYGDITIIDGKTRAFHEVKTGKKKDGRAIRQVKQLDSILEMLNKHQHTIGGQTASILMVPGRVVNLNG